MKDLQMREIARSYTKKVYKIYNRSEIQGQEGLEEKWEEIENIVKDATVNKLWRSRK